MYKIVVKVVKSKDGGYHTRDEAKRAKDVVERHLMGMGWLPYVPKHLDFH